jgi:hypothetical protein
MGHGIKSTTQPGINYKGSSMLSGGGGSIATEPRLLCTYCYIQHRIYH